MYCKVNIFKIWNWSYFDICIPLTCIFPPYIFACSKTEQEFPVSYVVYFYMFNKLRWEVIVRFVNIGEIVDLHCFQKLSFSNKDNTRDSNAFWIGYIRADYCCK